MTIELIGPSGTGILIEAISESTNHTMQEVKNVIAKTSAKIVPPGSTSWMFERHDGVLLPVAPIEVPIETRRSIESLVQQLEALDDICHVTTTIS
jgi:transcriptional/translational regulatory protein YebC/TACO1